MAEKRGDILDRGAGRSPELRRGVAQRVRRDAFQAGRGRIPAYTGIEGRLGHREHRRVGNNCSTSCRSGLPDLVPGRLWQFTTPNRAALGPHHVLNELGVERHPEADELTPPQARQNGGNDHGSIEKPGGRVGDGREERGDLV
jgi:hypothetical protein